MKHRGNNGNGRKDWNRELPSISFPGLSGINSISVSVEVMNYLNLFKKSGGI